MDWSKPSTGYKLPYSDEILDIEAGVSAEEFGQSLTQALTDSIMIRVRGKDSHVLQFITRSAIWTAGPDSGERHAMAPGYTLEAIEPVKMGYRVDSASKESPYYDSGGAHRREGAVLEIYDQPDVEHTKNLRFEQGADFDEMESHETLDRAHAIDFVFVENKIVRGVVWRRTGYPDGRRVYKVFMVQRERKSLPGWAVTALTSQGYAPPLV